MPASAKSHSPFTDAACAELRASWLACLGLAALLVLLPTKAECQFSPPASQAALQQFEAGGDSSTPEQTSATGRQQALTSTEIVNALQVNPDLLSDLKSQLAERLQQQGVQVDASEISDQNLFAQISTNARLRDSVTAVLRARGVVAADGPGSLYSASGEDDLPDSRSSRVGDDSQNLDLDNASHPQRSTSEGIPGVDVSSGRNGALPPPGDQRNPWSLGEKPRRSENGSASTDEPSGVRQRTPFDLDSLHDLYTQVANPSTHLERFGSDVFINRALSAASRGIAGRDSPLDVPLGPDYIIGAGDKLTIDLWGGVNQSFTRTIDRDGRVLLPEAGPIQVSGLSLAKAQAVIEGVLKPQFRNVQIALTVSGLRSIRVYVVGDVQRPGGYDISSLATPLSVLYAAGGPTAIGSLRTLRHFRGSELIEEVDLYDFLLHGMRKSSAPFQSGDTLLVPPAGPQVAITGAVKRPAIYELATDDCKLDTIIEDAGGITSAASFNDVKIERIDAHHQRETLTLPVSSGQATARDAVSRFAVRDGDRIDIEPILPFSQRAVYLSGHVSRPGRRAFVDGMRLRDVLRGYQDMLPEPAAVGEIVRLVPPDLHAETITFNIPDVLTGKANVAVNPFDTVRVFGRYQVDAPMVTIRGEVLRPGDYPMFHGETAAQLVRMAGGFKRDALTETADLTSYEVQSGREVTERLTSLRIGAAVSGADSTADVVLKPGDILAIHQITNWTNIGESVTIRGQVRYPGSYGFHDGERLSSVLQRAGGMLGTAYPAGAVLTRSQVKGLEESSRDALIRQIQANSAAARLSPGVQGSNSGAVFQMIKAQQDQVLADLESHPPTGRMVIHISADIESWANTAADIELRPGDDLVIPKRPGFVLVTGQVYNATALTFTPGKNASWYLSHAGGTNASANRKEIFIIRANGSVVGRHSQAMFQGDVLSTKLFPGDVVVVPQKIIGGSLFWRNLLSAGQLAASTAITAGVAAAAL